jgi:hypothetical protein
MSLRFALHLHGGFGADHYDLMIETDPAGPLATWQFAENPLPPDALAGRQGRRIADHRRIYLDYQGPVSRGRGQVRRLDGGEVRILVAGEDRLDVRFSGERLWGPWSLRRRVGDLWAFEPLPGR